MCILSSISHFPAAALPGLGCVSFNPLGCPIMSIMRADLNDWRRGARLASRLDMVGSETDLVSGPDSHLEVGKAQALEPGFVSWPWWYGRRPGTPKKGESRDEKMGPRDSEGAWDIKRTHGRLGRLREVIYVCIGLVLMNACIELTPTALALSPIPPHSDLYWLTTI